MFGDPQWVWLRGFLAGTPASCAPSLHPSALLRLYCPERLAGQTDLTDEVVATVIAMGPEGDHWMRVQVPGLGLSEGACGVGGSSLFPYHRLVSRWADCYLRSLVGMQCRTSLSQWGGGSGSLQHGAGLGVGLGTQRGTWPGGGFGGLSVLLVD